MLESDVDQLRIACKSALGQKDFARAEDLARQYVGVRPGDPTAARLLIEARAGQGNVAGALEVLTSAVEKFPNDAFFPYRLGVLYSNLYRHGWAEPHFRRALALAPDWFDANFMLGQNLSKAGRPSEAISYLERATSAEPNHFRSAFLLGISLESIGKFEEAAVWMERARSLKPEDADVAYQAEQLQKIASAPPPPGRFARWPEAAAEFQDLREAIHRHVLRGFDSKGFRLKPKMTVLTQGSCFAGNLAKSFSRYDLDVANIPFGEDHNNTFANKVVMQWLRDGVTDRATEIAAENFADKSRDHYRDILKRCDLYVYTLGVAPAFFNTKTGEFAMPRQTVSSAVSLIRNNTFRTTTVAENVENLRWIAEVVRSFNPKATIVLTVSPVPLASTPEMPSAVIADCVTKSTLRVAAHEFVQAAATDTMYWPSFEMVRWLGAHHGRLYGNDDGSAHHVDFQVIDLIIDSFVSTVGDPALVPLR